MGGRSFGPPRTGAHALAVFFAVAWLRPTPVAGQASFAGTAKNTPTTAAWTPPRTPDGQPDLQGVWLINTAAPLERPKALEGRPFLTDAEVVELRNRAARIFGNGNSDFGGGDNLFLAALANVDRYTSATSTENSGGMIEREFDNRTSLVIEPSDGRIPPLTPSARQRQDQTRAAGQHPPAGPEDLANSYRCITTGVPKLGGLYGAGHFSYYQILQAREYVVLATETIHDARIIPLDGRPHIPESIRQWNGDSRGRWEGSTLVVETTNFSPKSNFMGSADRLHLVERFTRVAPDAINYEITISDETTWTKAWTAAVPMKRSVHRLYEFACHEGNDHVMRGMLAGARADDKAAEDAAKAGAK
jgi:hypothetical protein